jgi:hypothetical protein
MEMGLTTMMSAMWMKVTKTSMITVISAMVIATAIIMTTRTVTLVIRILGTRTPMVMHLLLEIIQITLIPTLTRMVTPTTTVTLTPTQTRPTVTLIMLT